jgi:hypothetical protein
MTPAVLLRGAALYLERHGWTKGEIFANSDTERPFPAACTIGAINVTAHGRPVLSSTDGADDDLTDSAIRAMRVFAAWLDPDYDFGFNSTSAIDILGDWNDHDDRTAQEVIEALRDAANEWDGIHPTGGAR